jgi:hypothetical protein
MPQYKESEPGLIPDGIVRYFKVDRRDLVLLKFILEAYEGMSTLSTVEPTGVIIRLSIPCGFEEDVQSIIDSVGAAMPIQEVTCGTGDTANA